MRHGVDRLGGRYRSAPAIGDASRGSATACAATSSAQAPCRASSRSSCCGRCRSGVRAWRPRRPPRRSAAARASATAARRRPGPGPPGRPRRGPSPGRSCTCRPRSLSSPAAARSAGALGRAGSYRPPRSPPPAAADPRTRRTSSDGAIGSTQHAVHLRQHVVDVGSAGNGSLRLARPTPCRCRPAASARSPRGWRGRCSSRCA